MVCSKSRSSFVKKLQNISSFIDTNKNNNSRKKQLQLFKHNVCDEFLFFVCNFSLIFIVAFKHNPFWNKCEIIFHIFQFHTNLFPKIQNFSCFLGHKNGRVKTVLRFTSQINF